MSFNTIATQIVKNSIRSAICIDDEFAEPYENVINGIQFEIPQKLYQSFRTDGNCSLDFYRYKQDDIWAEKSKTVLSNKDLIILDWELDKVEPKYKNTLQILESIIDHGTNQFVIIYTHLEHLENIILNIQAFYSKINIATQQIDAEKIIEAFEISGTDIVKLESTIAESIPKGNIYSHECKLSDILTQTGLTIKEIGLFIKSCKNILQIQSNDEILEFLLLNKYMLRDDVNTFPRAVFRVECDHVMLNVNNTIILISNKSTDGEDGRKILPENLFNAFSDAITNKPNNAMALMACEMKDIFRSNIALIGNNIPKIDERAFYYHWNNLRKDDEVDIEDADDQFKYFLLQTWLNELSQFTIKTSTNVSFFKALSLYGEEQTLFNLSNFDAPIDELIKLGAHYSTINLDASHRSDKKIQFGDIFWKQDTMTTMNEVLLSITPHCDSIRPDKINNMLHFVRGVVVKSKKDILTALEKSETDQYSFLQIEDIPICIEWIPKPFTIYVNKENNDCQKLIEVKIKEVEYKLKHIAMLKENYTQRIANHSFSYAMRVGITLPNLKN
jgi:hypothetical protein